MADDINTAVEGIEENQIASETIEDEKIMKEGAVPQSPTQKEGSVPQSPTGSVDSIGSEGATGFSSMPDENEMNDNLSDDLSDTGWDTDLEIEDEKEEYDVTGGKVYTETCATLGITPVSYFLNAIRAYESNINMCHRGIGPKGAKAIAVALASNTNVVHLDLGDNGLGTEGTIAITSMMKENCYITNLNLSENGIGPPAAYTIAPMITSNSTLVHLELSGNSFDDKAAEPLAVAIRESYHIQFLDLSHNEIGEKGGQILGPALGDSEVLQHLNLSWNHIRLKGATALAEGLKNNLSLTILNLAHNGFAKEGAIVLADALKVNTNLKELDISNNRISTDGAVAFSKILPLNDTLKVLKFGYNPIQPAGFIAFLDVVKVCSSTNLQKTLNFDGVTITLAIEKAVKELSTTHEHLVITHGGTGGYKHPKPIQLPIEKLHKYCKENNVTLLDLFQSFDKEKNHFLSEEAFRNALKHISAPLMEYERLKLIKQFTTKDEGETGATPVPGATAKGKETIAPVFVDYRLLVETAKALKTVKHNTETVNIQT